MRASYNDGKTAITVQVTLYTDASTLNILDDDGATLASWPLKDVHAIAKGGGKLARRLRHGYDGAERINIKTKRDMKQLAAHCPRLYQTTPRSLRYWKPAIAMTAVAIVSVIVLIKVVVPVLAQQIVNIIPLSMDAKLGETSEEQIVSFFAWREKKEPDEIICRGEEGHAVLDALLARLAVQSDTPPTELRITVIDHDLVNAFALPGGRIILFNGLLQDIHKGNDLAGILAHEIGHEIKRHSLVMAFEIAGTSTLASLFFGDVSGGLILGTLSQSLLDSSYERDMERQADEIAIETLNKSGISGQGLADFFLRLEKKQGNDDEGVTSYFSSHPGSQQRSNRVRSSTTGKDLALSLDELVAIRTMCT